MAFCLIIYISFNTNSNVLSLINIKLQTLVSLLSYIPNLRLKSSFANLPTSLILNFVSQIMIIDAKNANMAPKLFFFATHSKVLNSALIIWTGCLCYLNNQLIFYYCVETLLLCRNSLCEFEPKLLCLKERTFDYFFLHSSEMHKICKICKMWGHLAGSVGRA